MQTIKMLFLVCFLLHPSDSIIRMMLSDIYKQFSRLNRNMRRVAIMFADAFAEPVHSGKETSNNKDIHNQNDCSYQH